MKRERQLHFENVYIYIYEACNIIFLLCIKNRLYYKHEELKFNDLHTYIYEASNKDTLCQKNNVVYYNFIELSKIRLRNKF